MAWTCGAASMGVGCCCSCSMLETALQLEELLVRVVGVDFEPTVARTKEAGGAQTELAGCGRRRGLQRRGSSAWEIGRASCRERV